MKALIIADRGPQKKIKDILSEQPVDLIITLGDLDKAEIQELADIKNIPKVGVYGNHCSGTYFELLGIQNMHLKRVNFQGFILGGFEGSVRYKPSAYAKMYTQEEAVQLLQNFEHVDIMICHAPPFGVNDEPEDPTHQGLKGLNEYILRERPKYLLHGHTYPTDETIITEYEGTKILYVHEYKIIDFN